MTARATEGAASSESLLSLIAAFRRKRIVVFGDLIADEFVYGRIARVSREAPVLILEYDATEIVPGGAGNAANNVASLGGTVRLVSLVRRAEPAAELSHAGQDAHPRRRHSFGEAAGGPDRSLHRRTGDRRASPCRGTRGPERDQGRRRRADLRLRIWPGASALRRRACAEAAGEKAQRADP